MIFTTSAQRVFLAETQTVSTVSTPLSKPLKRLQSFTTLYTPLKQVNEKNPLRNRNGN
jgi:hypothetical protein